MNDWFDLAQDITSQDALAISPEEQYYWLLRNITGDIKEALDIVPIEQLQTDLEKAGILFGMR